ncbi:hypothetical protein [Nonomuraea insulae]|uniref:Uncharacterized protein n=1 Tax=Nonomuraea insulae TaxID=1616787 RepID=A0ABW1CVW9_9ACTN
MSILSGTDDHTTNEAVAAIAPEFRDNGPFSSAPTTTKSDPEITCAVPKLVHGI